MKITATKDFGNTKNNKIVLPLVPEPTETVTKKEDLATVDLYSDPTDTDSTKVRFAFKTLNGTAESPRDLIDWRKNVDRAFTGLNSNTGLLQHQMMQQFCRGTALSTYNSNVNQLYRNGKASDVAAAQLAVDNYVGGDPNVVANLAQALTDAGNKTKEAYLSDAGDGEYMVTSALNQMMTGFLPNKVLQRVKRYLRREARKPFDMNIKSYYMNITRINSEEIPKLPPKFDETQSLAEDEIVDILLYGTPKSWQKEMDRQGFDPLGHTPMEVVAFMERIEASEEFDSDKKTTKVAASNKGKKKANDSNGSKGSHHCMLHGNNNTHDTSECKTLQAQAKKLKGNNGGSNKNGKSNNNKSWKNKAKDDTDDSKKELAALVKKATQLIKQQELNAIELTRKVEPVKKRKVKWPSAEELKGEQLLDSFDAELKDFNYGDLEQLDLKEGSDDEKEDGEMDISTTDEVSDEVSV